MHKSVEIAYEYLKERILNGTYRPSQKITELQLSEEIGVSRNTVTKALLKLEQENLISIEKNKGATVKSFTLAEVLNYLEIRRVLEGLSIRSAVELIQDSDIEKLGKITEQMSLCIQNNEFDAYSKLNKEFHQILYSASANQQAVDLINMIKTQLNRLQLRTILLPGRNEDSRKEHQAIFEAVRNRDLDGAERAIMQHVGHIRNIIEQNYQYLL